MSFRAAAAFLIGLSLFPTACRSRKSTFAEKAEARTETEIMAKENTVSGLVRQIGQNEIAEIVELHFLPPDSTGKIRVGSVRRTVRRRDKDVRETKSTAAERTDSSSLRELRFSEEEKQEKTDPGATGRIAALTAAGIILLTFIILRNNGKQK